MLLFYITCGGVCVCVYIYIYMHQPSFLTFSGEFCMHTLNEIGMSFLCHPPVGGPDCKSHSWRREEAPLPTSSKAVLSGSCNENNPVTATALEVETIWILAAAAPRDPCDRGHSGSNGNNSGSNDNISCSWSS